MVLDNYKNFIDQLITKIKANGIDLSNYELDHLGYKASSNEDYDDLKKEMSDLGEEVSEELVNGRRVGIYKLKEPLVYDKYIIPAMELIAPKEGEVCPSSLEHVEFVVDTSLEEFAGRYPTLDWNMTKINQTLFPMITLDLGSNTQVKFHHKPVLEIIKEKENKK